MACRVICVSRALGAGGEELARRVAGELGFRYVDDDIIVKAAAQAGVSAETVAEVEHTPGLLERILESMATSAMVEGGAWADAAVLPSFAAGDYRHLIEQVIRATAQEGKAVIVAHAASIPLAGSSGVLRVLVTASPQVRAARIAEAGNLDPKRAAKAVEFSDRERRAYFRRFYNLREELATHYDLVVNTDVLKVPQAAQLVLDAARVLATDDGASAEGG